MHYSLDVDNITRGSLQGVIYFHQVDLPAIKLRFTETVNPDLSITVEALMDGSRLESVESS